MSNKRMDVFTDKGIYTLILDEQQQYDDANVYELINDLNVAGTIWHGWTPYDDHNNDPAIIVFGTDAAIESVKLYEVEPIPVMEIPETTTLHLETPAPLLLELEYLGNQCVIKAVAYYHSEQSFDILPYEVNGVPTPNALSQANITAILMDHFTRMGFAASDVRVIAPEVPLNATDAYAYIVEFNRNGHKLHTGKAKAWHGWSDQGDPDAEE